MPFQQLLSQKPPGLNRDEIVDRVNLLALHASTGHDLDAVRRLCAPDIVCEFVGDKSRISYAGRHVGVETLASILRTINIDFEQLNYALSDMIVDGGRVAVRRTVEWRHRGTGRRGLVELADFARFEHGLMVEFVEYRDSIAILSMQGESDAA